MLVVKPVLSLQKLEESRAAAAAAAAIRSVDEEELLAVHLESWLLDGDAWNGIGDRDDVVDDEEEEEEAVGYIIAL